MESKEAVLQLSQKLKYVSFASVRLSTVLSGSQLASATAVSCEGVNWHMVALRPRMKQQKRYF